jgi:xanthine dehydrogenase small subunit
MTNRSIDIQITLNGKATALSCSAPTQTLLHALNAAGHSGTKEGCGDGDCGACTVVLLQTDANGVTRAVAVNSCLLPAGQLSGAHILTVEGLKALNGGALHPSQEVMVRHGGSQCGYCTPGFVMSLFAAFHSAEKALDDAAVEGNLCRCTGYNSIRRAMAELNDTPAFALAALPVSSDQASEPDAQPWLFRPTNLDAALRLKQQHPQAGWLAGATDLGLEFSRDALHPKPLIAIDALAEISLLKLYDGQLEIGAGVSLSRLQAALRGKGDLADSNLSIYRTGLLRGLYTMLHWFAATQVRNRATLGGNLGTASPISDLLPVMLALDAEIVLQSVRGERCVHASNYFLDYRKTALLPDELVRCVRINLAINPDASAPAKRTLTQSYKVGKRGSDDISIVAACFLLELDADDLITKARVAYGGIAAIPIRAIAAEALLLGQSLSSNLSALVRPALYAAFTPLSDFRGSADYRKQLIVNLFDKFLFEMTQSSEALHS